VTLIGSGALTPASRTGAGITSSLSTSYGANPPLSGVPALFAPAKRAEFKIDEALIEDEGVDAGLLSRGVVSITGVGGALRTEV